VAGLRVRPDQRVGCRAVGDLLLVLAVWLLVVAALTLTLLRPSSTTGKG
jgi:hypothetical protein